MTQITDPRFEEFRAESATPAQKQAIESAMRKNRFQQGLGIITRNAFIIPKALRNLALSHLGRFPLRSLEVAVGYECNFSCDQCSCALNHDPKRQRLSLDQFKEIIDQAVAMGAFQFNLNGGEPTIYFDEIKELCRHISSRGCYVHMATNGFFFTLERMKIMKDVGLCSFEMGLDSSVETLHDANRAQGSYRRIMENTEWAAKAGLMVAYNTVSEKEKIHNGDLINTIELARKMGVMLMMTPPCVTGNWAGKLDVLLNPEEQWYVKWLLARYPHTRIDNYNGLKTICCPAAREKMAINPYGDVVSCPLIQIVYGNATRTPLAEIQREMLKDPFYHKGLSDGCLPSHDHDFIRQRLTERDRSREQC